MNKKKLITLALLLTLSTTSCSSDAKESDAYSEYSKGNIYIGNREFLNNLSNVEEDDILILDKRSGKDPDMKIYNSYLIMDSEIIDEVLDVILRYESENPSDWNRTKKTMKKEWYIHNILYYLNFNRERTKDVDLNNNDEEFYANEDYLSLILAKKNLPKKR